jgi:DNA mismatch endonuclease (patch repair protein)
MPDNLTKEQRSRTMSRIRRRDTRPELLLRKAVWARGLRGYRLDDRRLPGRPDLAWTRKKVAVFIDGAFWHGHPSAFTHGKSGAYWDEKIARNIQRDRLADAALKQMGWTVFRFWDFEVRKECGRCVAEIEATLIAGTLCDAPAAATPPEPLQPRRRPAKRTLVRA